MANALLTSSIITKEALRILHQKLNFIGNINHAYDDSFAKTGAKIGDSLRIRLPNQYVVRDGRTLNTQDTVERSITLEVKTQKGVDINFTSVDLTLSLDDFSTRILTPAMTILAAKIEADAFNMIKDIPYSVNNLSAAMTFRQALLANKIMSDNLAPEDGQWSMLLNTMDNVDMVDGNKGLFQASDQISAQYKKGRMGTAAGYEFYQNTLLPTFQTGTAAATTGYTVNGASQTGNSLAVTGGTTTFNKGDIITLANVFRVHAESKVSQGVLQQFVVTADYAGGAGNLPISPAIVATGAGQNVTGSPAAGAAVGKIGSASGLYRPSLGFHKDAFTFATADLIMPDGVDFAARKVMDGISMRIIRAYDINNDTMPCRLDVLYGYKTLREELAVRILNNPVLA